MMCFRDTTFCSAPNCKNKCGRKPPHDLTFQVDQWWGRPGGPVAWADFCSEQNTTDSKGGSE